ncbi:MAG: hypothetical protein ABIG39_04880 [Candidatus Micrarchaeota archaeon]
MKQLRSFEISGISSMIRDLSLLSGNVWDMERGIQAGKIDAGLFRDLRVAAGEGNVGDLVLFKVETSGSYNGMETLWGKLVPLEVGRHYMGVLCERGSTKFMTAEFPEHPFPISEGLELQLVAQGGGVGYVTGFSPQLKNEGGSGTACDVLIEGLVWSEGGEVLNISQTGLPAPGKFEPGEIPPNILLLGTATDVGKTTVAKEIIKHLSKRYACGAVKASGTGWYEDSLIHMDAGAFPVLSYTFAGLPTTYYVKEERYVAAMESVYWALAHPETIGKEFIDPKKRDGELKRPDVIFTEHGGDLIWANIPTFLKNGGLMESVFAIVICCESAVSLLGALGELKRHGVDERIRVYASVPLTNPEGFFRRVQELLGSGVLAGVLDVNKPAETEDTRKRYSMHYNEILSPEGLAGVLEKDLSNLR